MLRVEALLEDLVEGLMELPRLGVQELERSVKVLRVETQPVLVVWLRLRLASQRRRAVVKERVAVRRRLQLGRSVRVVRLQQRLPEVMEEERRAAVLRGLVLLRRRRLEMEEMRGETKGLPLEMEEERREERTMERQRALSPRKERALKERERMAVLVERMDLLERMEQARSPKPHRRL